MRLGSKKTPSTFRQIFHEPEHLGQKRFMILKALAVGEDYIKYEELGVSDKKTTDD